MSADLLDEWIARTGHMLARAEKAERQVAAVRALALAGLRSAPQVVTFVDPAAILRALDSADEVDR